MTKFFSKIKSAISFLCDFIDTPYFALILVCIELFSHYFGLDLLIICVISFCLTFVFVFKKNLNCTLMIFFFMSSMISLKNSPANTNPDSNSYFYFQPAVYITCIIFASIPVIAITLKAIKNIVNKRISLNAFFISTLVLGLFFLTNGLFRDSYNPLDAMFGVFMFFFFVILPIATVPFLSLDKKSLVTISTQIGIYLLVPILELFSLYIKFLASGAVLTDRENILFLGWGNRNTLGMLFTISLPFVLFLTQEQKSKKFEFVSCLLLFTLIVSVALTFSRQAYLFSGLFVVFYFFYLLLKNKRNQIKQHIIIVKAFGLFFIVFFLLEGFNAFEILSDFAFSNGRMELWTKSVEAFLTYPFFGGGFFFYGGDEVVGLYSIMPCSAHNSLFEVLGACGAFGLLAYLTYRFFSIKSIYSNYSKEKFTILCSFTLFLLISLLDIHLFDFFGTCIYSVLLAMLVSKKKSAKEELNSDKQNDLLSDCALTQN